MVLANGGLDLRRRQPGDPVYVRRPDTTPGGDATGTRRIRCPQCDWQPSESSRWSCVRVGPPENYSEGCGTVWNTFETGGQCPGCQHVWEWTSCLACFTWSRHVEWYETDAGDG